MVDADFKPRTREHITDYAPPPRQPAPPPPVQQSSEERLASAMDVVTSEIVKRIDDLSEQLKQLKEFVTADAERVKGELSGHIGVRDKARELTEHIRSEMETIAKSVSK